MAWLRMWQVGLAVWMALLAPSTIPSNLEEDGHPSGGLPNNSSSSSSSPGVDPAEQDWQLQAITGAQMTNPLRFKFRPAPRLRVAAESWPPHIQVVRDQSGQLKAVGPMANFLDLMAVSLNFTYDVVQGDGYWGVPQENGSWNGMIGMLLRKVRTSGQRKHRLHDRYHRTHYLPQATTISSKRDHVEFDDTHRTALDKEKVLGPCGM